MSLPSTTETMNVLVIDDSRSDLALTQTLLTQKGHQVLTATSCAHALALLKDPANAIDIILLDQKMPQVDGFETARRIRRLEHDQGDIWRPIIFLSGCADAEIIEQGVDAGGDDYLRKPVNTRILLSKLKAMQRIAKMRLQLLETQQALQKEANTDGLTSLYNRRYFIQRLNDELARARRHQTPLCLAYLDLDHFKQINDHFGHAAGDHVLCATSHMLARSIRQEDLIGRLGGEEFCICMPQINLMAAQQACERYRALVSALSFSHLSSALNVTISIGLTHFIPATDNAETLLSRADSALYHAKSRGRNRVECITQPVQPRSQHHA